MTKLLVIGEQIVDTPTVLPLRSAALTETTSAAVMTGGMSRLLALGPLAVTAWTCSLAAGASDRFTGGAKG